MGFTPVSKESYCVINCSEGLQIIGIQKELSIFDQVCQIVNTFLERLVAQGAQLFTE